MTETVRKSGKHRVQYGSETVEYWLSYSRRSRLSIVVEPSGKVEVHAPLDAECEAIEAIVKKRSAWIIRQLDRFESFGPKPPPKSFASGETHYYLGRQYRLKIVESGDIGVKLVGRFFEIGARDRKDSTEVEQLLDGWFRKRAEEMFPRYIERQRKNPLLRSLKEPLLKIRKMSRRWGSCTRNGTIILNPALVHASIGSIEYVITHELCHLIHYSHNTSFYRLLTRAMPDWESRKRNLEQVLG